MSTPVPADSALPSMPLSPAESLGSRVTGILRAPRATYHAIAAAPRSADVLILVFLVIAASSALVLETRVGQLALLDLWDRTAAAFGRPVTDATYAAMVQWSAHGSLYAIGLALLSGPIVAVGGAALLKALLPAGPGAAPSSSQLLAVSAHAGVILALRQVVAAPITYARETLANPVSLNLAFAGLDGDSPAARLLGIVDLFVVWWLVVLAIGVSVLYRRPARRLALLFVGAYLLLALAAAGAMALAGGPA